MLAPLDAISLASSVVAFVDFTISVVAKAKEIYETGSDLEELRLRVEAKDSKSLNEDLAKQKKLLKVIPADEDFNGSRGVLDTVLKAKKDEKFRKKRKELSAINDRIEIQKALVAVAQSDYDRQQKKLNYSTKDLHQMSDRLKNREVRVLLHESRLARGERVSSSASHSIEQQTKKYRGTRESCIRVQLSC